MKPNRSNLPPAPTRTDLTYGSYLKINDLLNLQNPKSDPEQHDEMLFILIHQIYELWFKQILHEMDAATQFFKNDQILPSHKVFKRINTIQKVLIDQIYVLETMTPLEFNHFRSLLNPASGFQSHQFRELEYLCGLKDRRYLVFHENDPIALEKLKKRLESPSIRDELKNLMVRQSLCDDSHMADHDPELEKAILEIYNHSEKHYGLYLLCELLIEFDESLQLWRFRHVQMVERMIGNKRGTGGSSGANYLKSTLNDRIFPELWSVRNQIGSWDS